MEENKIKYRFIDPAPAPPTKNSSGERFLSMNEIINEFGDVLTKSQISELEKLTLSDKVMKNKEMKHMKLWQYLEWRETERKKKLWMLISRKQDEINLSWLKLENALVQNNN